MFATSESENRKPGFGPALVSVGGGISASLVTVLIPRKAFRLGEKSIIEWSSVNSNPTLPSVQSL
jgi:hypothetical protein